MTHEEADTIAIKALQYISGDSTLLTRFLDLSGLTPQDLRSAANGSDFWAAIVDFLRQDESECITFASNMNLSPQDIQRAAIILNGQETEAWDN